jgi:hypothetical protein
MIITQNANKQVEDIHERMPVILNDELLGNYLEYKISFEELFKNVNILNTELNFYEVGDLVNKMSNQGKDNILHKDEVKYDKNKTLKITNFFQKKGEEAIIKNSESKEKKKDIVNPPSKKNDKLAINLIEIKDRNNKNDVSTTDDLSTQVSSLKTSYYQGKRKSGVYENSFTKSAKGKSKKKSSAKNENNKKYAKLDNFFKKK